MAARSESSQPNLSACGSASSISRRPSISASTQTITAPFAQAARKFGGRMKCSAIGRAPALPERTKRDSTGGISLGAAGEQRRRCEISEPDRKGMRADLPPLARLAAGADVLEVARAANAQTGAISLLPLAHLTDEQRCFVGGRLTPGPLSPNSRPAFIACQPPAPDKSFSVIWNRAGIHELPKLARRRAERSN